MTTAVVKVKPEDYELTVAKGNDISDAFLPKIIERDAIVEVYEQIIKKDINAETCAEAGTLRKELVKVRTAFAATHKAQKNMFLQAGRFVDAIKYAETLPVTQMEDTLKGIENHFENIEKARIKKLEDERRFALSEYDLQEAMLSIDLGAMPEPVWINYLAGVKKTYEDKVEAELKEAEELAALEAAEEVFSERQLIIASYSDFEPNQELSIQTTNDEFVDLLDNLKTQKAEHDAEQEKIRLKNIELQKKVKKDAADKKKCEAKEKKEKAERDAKEAELKAEKDALEAELKAKEDARIKAEQEEKERIDAEKQAELDKLKKAELAPDKDKLMKVVTDLQAIKLPEVKNDDAAEIVTDIQSVINKAIAYIELKVEELN